MNDGRTLIDVRVTDLKQWCYCRRVVFWTYCLPVQKKLTFKMEHGAAEHEVLSALESRRKLREYGLTGGKRFFHVPLRSERLGLSGTIDLLVVTDDGRYVPIEFKDTTGPVSANHRLQLAGYSLLVEDVYGVAVDLAFVYRIPLKRVTEVPISAVLRRRAESEIERMQEMLASEVMPPPTPRRARCVDCEFRRFCGDVG